MHAKLFLGLVLIAASSLARAETTIYRCDTPAGLVFSDRPCGNEAQLYEPDLSGISVMESQPAKTTPVKAAKPASVRVASSSSTSSKTDVCLKLNESLHKIAATLRSGYTAKEGERLKERKRELEARRRAQKC